MWFKVDDGWWRHRKTRRLTRSHPDKRRDAGAAGLWSLAGNWCAGASTSGWIPEDELEQFDDDWQELAKHIVAAGYWTAEQVDGEPGYRFHDWEEYQPRKVDMDRLREVRSEAGRVGGQRSGEARRTKAEARSKQTRTKPEAKSNQSRSKPVSKVEPRPDPTRPDPSVGSPLY